MPRRVQGRQLTAGDVLVHVGTDGAGCDRVVEALDDHGGQRDLGEIVAVVGEERGSGEHARVVGVGPAERCFKLLVQVGAVGVAHDDRRHGM